jgi:tRNA dimethylallyltransferase
MGIEYERSVIKHKITQRLHDRLNNGMIQEVETLIQNGITHQKLESLGLEYRYISLYLQKRISKEQMIEKLNIAIHQFSKRQMTFFRNIEKNGTKIHWLSKGNLDVALKLIT